MAINPTCCRVHHCSVCPLTLEHSSTQCRAASTTPQSRVTLPGYVKYASSGCPTHEASSDLGIFFVPRSDRAQAHLKKSASGRTLKHSSATRADIDVNADWEDDDPLLAKSEVELLGHVDEARKLFGLRRQLLDQCLEATEGRPVKFSHIPLAVARVEDPQRVPKLNLRNMSAGTVLSSVRSYSRRVADPPPMEERPCSQRSDMLSPIIAESGVHVRASSRSYLPSEPWERLPPRAMTPPADSWLRYDARRKKCLAASTPALVHSANEASSKLPPMIVNSSPTRRKKLSGHAHPHSKRL